MDNVLHVISGGKNCPKEVPISEEYFFPALFSHTEEQRSRAAFEVQDSFLVNCMDFFSLHLVLGI